MTGARRRFGAWCSALLVAACACTACGYSRAPQPTNTVRKSTASPSPRTKPSRSTPTAVPNTVRLVAAGDIACNPLDRRNHQNVDEETGCRYKATSDLVLALHPTAVLALGDTQYQRATLQGYRSSYGPTWGRFRSITHPVIGNHEYLVPYATDYFAYFGRAAGDPRKGYYSFDVGRWHVVVLNDSGCNYIGGCGAGSLEEQWLRHDLAVHRNRCTLAALHEPRWSSGVHHSDPAFQALWADLYVGGVDVLLAGHDHDYERFVPLDEHGRPDPQRGVREFVVGTGGVGLQRFSHLTAPGTVVKQNTTFGVLSLTLRPSTYDWRFVPVGNGFHDSGRGTCH